MITEEKNEKLDKIRKLLAKAEAKGVTEEERKLYQAKAAELMMKWGIEDAMLGDVKAAEIIYQTHTTVGPKIYRHEYVLMGIKIAYAFTGVKAFFSQFSDDERLGIIGFADDVERVVLLWRSLETQLSMALANEIAGRYNWSRLKASEKYQFRRSFILGFGREVGERLERLYREIVETSATPGTDLVLANRQAQVDDWASKNLNLTFGGNRRSYANSGLGAGRSAGARADIGQSGVAASGQRAIGG